MNEGLFTNRMLPQNNFLDKFKGKANRVSKLGINALFASQGQQILPQFQDINIQEELTLHTKRTHSKAIQKLRNLPSVEKLPNSKPIKERIKETQKTKQQLRRNSSQKLPGIYYSKQMQLKSSVENIEGERFQNEKRIDKIIRSTTKAESKYKQWNFPQNLSQNVLRFFDFGDGATKLMKGRASSRF